MPLAGLTAWQTLVDTAALEAGQRVLIHAAAGGVGHLAVQIAKARGAHVIGTASGSKQTFLAELGVDQAIDYTEASFEDEIDERSLEVLTEGGLLIAGLFRAESATSFYRVPVSVASVPRAFWSSPITPGS